MKMNKKFKVGNWINHHIPLEQEILLTKDLLQLHLNKFWKEIVKKIDNEQHILFLFRIQFVNNVFSTVGQLQKINKDNKEYLLNYLLNILEIKSSSYTEIPIKSLTFSYGIRHGKLKDKAIENPFIKLQTFQHYKLPITIDPLEYGKLLDKINNKYIIQVNPRNLAIIEVIDNTNFVKYHRLGELILEYKDTKVNDTTFIREIGRNKFTYVNNKLVLLEYEKQNKFITKIKTDKKLENNILSMDLETYLDKANNHIPNALVIYEEKNVYKYYISDYNNDIELMLSTGIKKISIRKYDNYKICLHNFSKFDGIFLLKILSNLGKIKPLIHNGNIISIQFNYNNVVLHFRDSYLLIPGALRRLAKSFMADAKGFFPYLFVKENTLLYEGIVPDYSFFKDNLTMEEYITYSKQYINKNWNLRDECLKYCEQDCITLFQVVSKFNELIFNKWKLNAINYPTLPSLAFAIFRCHYMPENTIPQIAGQMFNDIKQAYTGGACDMYIPSLKDCLKLFCYDINSLYPFVMSNFPMPIGKISYFQGNIRNIKPDAFGFFYCKIKAPDNLQHPILQTHVKTPSGIKTIAPLGTWFDMLSSIEFDNAIKYGYYIEILWGYTSEKGNIFSPFINELYEMRLNYPKSDPMNYIAKIIMNSLYGRFGMDDSFLKIQILDKKSYKTFESKNHESIHNIIELGNNILVQYKNEQQDINTIFDNFFENHNINIAIAATVTAAARVHMSQFKNNPNYNLYYTDTDSIYIDKPLDESLVSSTVLGKLKLEYECIAAIFISPKFYCLLTAFNEFIYKVKGLNHDIKLDINDFKYLLTKNSFLERTQEKWFKSFSEGSISVREQLYTLKITGNKRELIYDENNRLIATKPYIIDESKEIK